MIRIAAATAVLALLLAACAEEDSQIRNPPAYVPAPNSQAPLLSGATVTGDTITEENE